MYKYKNINIKQCGYVQCFNVLKKCNELESNGNNKY